MAALVGLATVAAWALGVGPLADADRAGTVEGCTTIDRPGEYVLADDVVDSEADTCIRVRASDVVIEGRGHAIDGTGGFGTAGVVVRPAGDSPLANVTVRNVTVTDWDDGIRYVDVAGGTVVGTETARNRVGLSLLNARDVRLAGNVATDNRLRGIALAEASANNTLVDNAARGNDLFGISLLEAGVRNNTLVDNRAVDNEFGVVLIGARDNDLVGTETDGNRIAGIWLAAAHDNRIRNSSVSDRFYGIFLADLASGNEVRNNAAADNQVGIRLRSAHGNTVAGNVVEGSGDFAILLVSSDDNRVVDNRGSGNERGVGVVRSSGNELRNNTVD